MIEFITLFYLSQVATSGGISAQDVGTIIATIILGLLGGGFIGKKVSDAKKMTIEPQPFMVKMTEEFVTRREFSELKAEIRNDFTKIEGLFGQTMQKVELTNQATAARIEKQSEDLGGKLERQNERLADAIADGIEEGRKGRVALWNELNPLRGEVKALEATQDVAEQLGKLGDALMKAIPPKPGGR